MGIVAWFRRLRPSWKAAKSRTHEGGALREFVYLDDVSVYSLLASRKGGIATEFSESQEVTKSSDVSGSASVGVSATKTSINSNLHDSQMQASQILRKAIVQTSFKELYEMECESLVLASPPPSEKQLPSLNSMEDLEEELVAPSGTWAFDPSKFSRGGLLEAQVELEADPIYRMVSIVATFQELVVDNESLFGEDILELVPQIQAIAQLLDRLLVGLVPIRGRLTGFRWMKTNGREVLVHRRLLEQLRPTDQPESFPVYVVGVAQSGLFWKDIRRLLFSQAKYSVFCRLAVSGLAKAWHPVKLADVLSGVSPEFDSLLKEFSARASAALSGPIVDSQEHLGPTQRMVPKLVETYIDLLVSHHKKSLDPGSREHALESTPSDEEWLESIDTQRAVLLEVTRRIDKSLGVETSRIVAHDLRGIARQSVGIAPFAPYGGEKRSESGSVKLANAQERYLDTEIIAIYW